MHGPDRDRWVKAHACPWPRSESDRAQVARVFIHEGASNAETASELLRIHQVILGGRGVLQPLGHEVREALELIVLQADVRI